LVRSFLYGVAEHDWLTIVAVSILLLAVGLVASYLPARRAAKIEPVEALRTE
jgi:ABC-type antimicrobial peptide transport system permease subunit